MDFEALEIDRSFISELVVVPSRDLRVHLFLRPRRDGEKQVVEEYDLVFEGMRGYRINVEAEPWLEIKSHRVLNDSSLLSDYLSRGKERNKVEGESNGISHFQLVCEEGQIDILSVGFSIIFIKTLPFFEPKQAKRGENSCVTHDHPIDTEVAEQTRCTFCGRDRTMVSRIIVGPTANICSECVALCSETLKR